MAQEDIDRMRAGYEAMARGDYNAVLDLMDPEIEIRDRPEIPDPQTYRGREGVLTALSRNTESFDDLEMVPESFVERGDKMVVCILLRGRGRACHSSTTSAPPSSVASRSARCRSSRRSPLAARLHSARKAGAPSGSRAIARSTSSAATLPDPSQTEPIWMSR